MGPKDYPLYKYIVPSRPVRMCLRIVQHTSVRDSGDAAEFACAFVRRIYGYRPLVQKSGMNRWGFTPTPPSADAGRTEKF